MKAKDQKHVTEACPKPMARRGAYGDEPSPAKMAELFRRGGLDLPEAKLALFWSFHELLRARDEEADLTRLKNFESIVFRHYVDSAMAAGLTDLPSPLLDIGTGAGFPGIPLKIVRPDLKIVLAESRGRKLAFLEEAIQVLGLDRIEVYPHKVTANFDLPVQGVITRDLEPMALTLERAAGFLPRGGKALFMKGPGVDPELNEALALFEGRFRLVSDTAYTLGESGFERRLIVLEKVSSEDRQVPARSPLVKDIGSAQNPDFKLWQKLADSRGIRKQGLSLLSGPKQVREVLRDFPDKCLGILTTDRNTDGLATPPGIRRYRLRSELFRELDVFGAGAPLLLIKVDEFPIWEDRDWPKGCTLFIGFQDPANVGAVIRSAAAFGAARAVLLKEAAHPFHPRSLRAAGPAVFQLPLFSGPSIAELDVKQVPLISLGLSGRDIRTFDFPETFGLAPGVEGPGLPPELAGADQVTIPMAPGVESLNAASATAVALYAWRENRGF